MPHLTSLMVVFMLVDQFIVAELVDILVAIGPDVMKTFGFTVTTDVLLILPLAAVIVVVPAAFAVNVVDAFPSEPVTADAGLTLPTVGLLLVHVMVSPDITSPY